MAVLAVTGAPASGKSTVVKLLREKGAVIFDADRKVHSYYRDRKGLIYKQVAGVFAPVLDKKGDICRRKLAAVVFRDKEKLHCLEEIVYPRLFSDLKTWIKRCRIRRGCYAAEVPLLFEKKLDRLFDTIVLVTAPKRMLIMRMMRCRRLTAAEARQRLELYLPVKDKTGKSDFIVRNNGDMKKIFKEVDLLWKKIAG